MPDLTAEDFEETDAEQRYGRKLEQAKASLGETRRERDTALRQLQQAQTENAELREVVELFGRLGDSDPSPPAWLSPKQPKQHHGTLMLLLSDTHFDEVVKPEEVDGLNAYDREIATLRLKAWAENVVKLARHYLSGITYDGFVLMLGGDTFSGSIHDELKETNADTLFGGLLYWLEMGAAAVDMLANEFGKGHVVAVPGNHGRQTRKPRMKLRARDNLDWLYAKLLEREFRQDKRLSFAVPESVDHHFDVYGRGHLLAHGDAVKGGGGIGGIWPPIKRYRARLAEHANTIGQPFDTLWLGHWHQLVPTPTLVVNGALKGYDEFARICGFSYEPPQQAMAIATPERGLTWQAPVFAENRAEEGW